MRASEPTLALSTTPAPAHLRPVVEGYLRHLLSVQEPTGARLVTQHNLTWLLRFVAEMREAIAAGRFAAFRTATLAIWA